MSSLHSNPILFNAVLSDPESGEGTLVRYLQVGLVRPSGFCGLVTDVCGGGEWADLYVIDGERLSPKDLGLDEEEADDADGDAYEDHVEAQLPGLLERVYARRKELVRWESEGGRHYPVATEALLGLAAGVRDERIGDDGLEPIDGMHTSFA